MEHDATGYSLSRQDTHAHMPYGRALAVIAFTQIVGAVYLHANGRSLRPGVPRLVAILPVVAFNVACPLLFDRHTDITTIVLVAFNFAWLSRYVVTHPSLTWLAYHHKFKRL